MRGALIRSVLGFSLCVFALAGTSNAAEAGKSRLEQIMGSKFHEAGLDRATPAEIAVLEQFMIEHAGELRALERKTDTTSAAAVTGQKTESERRAEKAAQPNKEAVTSRIAGEFKGWRHGTTLTLENGQQWSIDDDSTLAIRATNDHPTVTIKPGMFGHWWLRVEGYTTTAQVKPAN